MQQPATPTNKNFRIQEKLAIERTVMANDRTLLSFIRTSLYFFVAGLTLNQLVQLQNELLITTLCFLAGAIIFVIGSVKYFSQLRKIDASRRHIEQ